MKAWREFEELIVRLHQQALPGMKVEHDAHITGRTGRVRQVDVAITGLVGPYPVLIVLECKRSKRPVDIDQVEGFVTKLGDLGAAKGIMVAAAFDEGARAAAKQNWITLVSYKEAADADWSSLFQQGSWQFFYQRQTELLTCRIETASDYSGEIPATAVIRDVNREIVGTLGSLIDDLRKGIQEGDGVGDFTMQVEPNKMWFFEWEDRLERVLKLTLAGRTRIREFPVNLGIVSGHVLRNAEGKITIAEMTSQILQIQHVFHPDRGRELTPDEYRTVQAKRPRTSRTMSFSVPPDTDQLRVDVRIGPSS